MVTPTEDSREPAPPSGPRWRGGYPVWAASDDGVQVRFVGRGPDGSLGEVLRRVEGRALPVAEARQVHSARVLPAREGNAGPGDALWTDRRGLALSVITADCAPVVLAVRGGGPVAVVHAGWRGIASGIVGRAVNSLGAPASRIAAWVGPAIGACCYEVDSPVADRVTAASGGREATTAASAALTVAGPRGRPHLDLPGAVARQLRRAGVLAPCVLVRCTRCDAQNLWSYRREGPRGGRNVTYVWREV